MKAWLKIGGRRLDSADSYNTQVSVGLAMKASGVPRSDIFLLQKVGNTNPMVSAGPGCAEIAGIRSGVAHCAAGLQRHLDPDGLK